ncbi:MAG: ATP synthase F1 subunit gamma [Bacteroidales bacterium]|nr:ATP synthase F1 subunit gamma [Bacteroidales bacterium]MCL2738807.1 ATP synthase F1 subunit gamma [Bacteroidales bacterium]
MASLKEVKSRIVSVENTKKITMARQMISSARLHQMQGILEKTGHYTKELEQIAAKLVGSRHQAFDELSRPHGKGVVAIVIMSSNSGMCGSFNAKMIKELHKLPDLYPNEQLLFFPIGKKIREALAGSGYEIHGNFDELASKMLFKPAAQFMDELMNLFRSKEIKRADILYYHFKSMAAQCIKQEQLLPFIMTNDGRHQVKNDTDVYIFEPSRKDIFNQILPQMLRAKFLMALADHQTAEHAARTLAMQMASENANDILEELRLSYNKLRQQNITSELLDIVGGTFA